MLAGLDTTLIWDATLDTLYMVSLSAFFTALLGIPLGVLLVITDEGHIWGNRWLNRLLSGFVNLFRAIPFIILVLLLFPLSKLLIGTTLGPTAASIPLIVGVAPFYARLVETGIREVDSGVIEAARAMGASRWGIVRKVLLPEALPSIVSGLTVTCVSLISFSAMAGIVGGGGLGDVAYRYGFQSFNDQLLYACGILLVILVQIVQMLGDRVARKLDKR